MWDGGPEDVQHAVARLVPDLECELLSIKDHDILQAVGSRPRQLFIICKTKHDDSVSPSHNVLKIFFSCDLLQDLVLPGN